MKKIWVKIILIISIVFNHFQLPVAAQDVIEIDYYMRSGIHLKDSTYIFYNFSNSIMRYDFKTNELKEIYGALDNINRTGSVISGDVYFVGTNYSSWEGDEINFNIRGFNVNDLSVVYDLNFDFVQKVGQRFAVDKYHNFYFTDGNKIVSYDKNGNKIDEFVNDHEIQVKQVIDHEKFLILTDVYEGCEASIKIDNGRFIGQLKLNPTGTYQEFYQLNDNGNYAITHNGNLMQMTYEDDNGPNFYAYNLFSVKTSGNKYAFSGDFEGDKVFIGDKNGNIYYYDLNTLDVLCEQNIGHDKIIYNIYVLDSKLYVFYIQNSTYYLEIFDKAYFESYQNPSKIHIDKHTTLNHTQEDIRVKYFELMDAYDYENNDIYVNKPNLQIPYYEGTLKEEVLQDYLNQVNFFRWLAGVNEVTLNKIELSKYQKAAITQALNNEMSHWPTQPNGMDNNFYLTAYMASGSSNLQHGQIGYQSSLIESYVNDNAMAEDSFPIGHRLSILNKDAFEASFGTVLKDGIYWNSTYIGKNKNGIESENQFSAWPVAGYMPKEVFDINKPWSITFYDDVRFSDYYFDSTLTLIHRGVEYKIDNAIGDMPHIYFEIPEQLKQNLKEINLASGSEEIKNGEEVTIKVEKAFNKRNDEVSLTYTTKFMSLYDIYPESVEISANKRIMQPNDTFQYFAIIQPNNTTHYNLQWSSSDPSIVSIDEKGLATAHKPGTAIITVTTENGLTDSGTVIVKNYVNKVELDDITINKNEKVQLTAKIYPEDATINTTPIWFTKNSDIVSMNYTGEITGIKPGKAEVGVIIDGKEATCTVTVLDTVEIKPITSIKFKKTSEILEIDHIKTIIATVYPEDTTDSKVLKWESSNPNVVSVDQEGNITGISVGSAVVTATTVNNIVATCLVTVAKTTRPITSIVLDKKNETLNIGDSIQLTATIKPANTTTAKTLTWISSDPNIASVDANGYVTAISAGTTTITVKTLNQKIATCTITVKDDENINTGDVNNDGKVNQLDRMTLARYLAKWQGYDQINDKNSDVNSDNKVNQLDRMTLARYLAKWQGYEILK